MTPERYASPAAFKQAVEHRLRERAAAEGVELARLRQLLVFDRFLARMAAAFGDRVIVKGGLVVELRVRRARTTKDIDLRLLGDREKALGKIQQAGRVDLGDFLAFEVRQDPRRPEIEAEGMRYPGRRYRVRGLLAAKLYGSPFGLDVAFAEPFSGAVEEVEGVPFLAFAGVSPAKVRIYPLEAHIAEKLHAFTMPRTTGGSHPADVSGAKDARRAFGCDSSAGSLGRGVRRDGSHRRSPLDQPRGVVERCLRLSRSRPVGRRGTMGSDHMDLERHGERSVNTPFRVAAGVPRPTVGVGFGPQGSRFETESGPRYGTARKGMVGGLIHDEPGGWAAGVAVK